MLPFTTCTHSFHKDCIGTHIRMQVEDNKIPIRCPDTECNTEITQPEALMLVPDKKFREKYLTFELDKAALVIKTLHHCQTPGCKGIYDYKPKHLKDTKFTCKSCKVSYCLYCGIKWHKGLTCRESKKY